MNRTVKELLTDIATDFCIEDFVDDETLLGIKDNNLTLTPDSPAGKEVLEQMKEYFIYYSAEEMTVLCQATDDEILAAAMERIKEFAEYYEPEED